MEDGHWSRGASTPAHPSLALVPASSLCADCGVCACFGDANHRCRLRVHMAGQLPRPAMPLAPSPCPLCPLLAPCPPRFHSDANAMPSSRPAPGRCSCSTTTCRCGASLAASACSRRPAGLPHHPCRFPPSCPDTTLSAAALLIGLLPCACQSPASHTRQPCLRSPRCRAAVLPSSVRSFLP